LLCLALGTGCGSSASNGGSAAVGPFNPATAQTASQAAGYFVDGTSPQGSVYMYLERGAGSDVGGTGLISRGTGGSATLQAVAAQGTQIGDNLVVLLYPEDAAPGDDMLLAGTVGGQGSLSVRGQSAGAWSVQLSSPAKSGVSTRWLTTIPEKYEVECRFIDNSGTDVFCTINIDIGGTNGGRGPYYGTYTSSRPFGPIEQKTSGTVEAQNFGGNLSMVLFTDQGVAARLVFKAPENLATPRTLLDSGSSTIITSGNPNVDRFGVMQNIQAGGTIEVKQ